MTDTTVDTARRLATIEQISNITPIPDADLIVKARIRGWDVVVKRDEFKPGDLCVYFEVDTMLDTEDPRFAWLAPRGVRTDPITGHSGHVLRTAKLRGQYSQGLALPIASFPELSGASIGDDVAGAVGVTKWDPPLPAELSGAARGRLPSWIPVTDEERIQNIPGILAAADQTEWAATEKIDGTSTTFCVDPDGDYRHGVCGRTLDLIETPGNTMWRLARDMDIHALLSDEYPGQRVALQGETYGAGIQGNPLKLKDQWFAAFTLIINRVRVPRGEWPAWIHAISVPVRGDLKFPASLAQALTDVDGLKSVVAPGRPAEGVVWRSLFTDDVTVDGQQMRASFKVISNKYLMKHDR